MNDLTKQELDVLCLLAKGLKTHEIAKELNVTKISTKMCIGKIFRKLGVKNRVQAVVKAITDDVIKV